MAGTYSVRGTGETAPVSDAVVRRYGLNREITATGDVIYTRDGVAVLRDEGREIHIVFDPYATQIGVALSQEKWQGQLTIQGSYEARKSFAREILTQDAAVEFNDAMEERHNNAESPSKPSAQKPSAAKHYLR